MGNRPYVWEAQPETHEYDDIIRLPHYVSSSRPHMTMLERAAQFSPYDALTGYSDQISETARTTDEREELSEQKMNALNDKIILLHDLCQKAQRIKRESGSCDAFPVVTITYFKEDKTLHRKSKKSGGTYLTRTGRVHLVDLEEGFLVFESAAEISPAAGTFAKKELWTEKAVRLRIMFQDITRISEEASPGIFYQA